MKWPLHAWSLVEQLCGIAGSRIDGRGTCSFPQPTRYPRERQAVERRRATGGLRHDVVHVERGFLTDLRDRQYSHRSLARSRTRRCNETGMCPVLIPALGSPWRPRDGDSPRERRRAGRRTPPCLFSHHCHSVLALQRRHRLRPIPAGQAGGGDRLPCHARRRQRPRRDERPRLLADDPERRGDRVQPRVLRAAAEHDLARGQDLDGAAGERRGTCTVHRRVRSRRSVPIAIRARSPRTRPTTATVRSIRASFCPAS